MTVQAKERLHWIDVAKGLLILLVVYGHLYAWTRKFNPEAADVVLQSLNLFLPFYMPAFFVITGYCSNFKKPFLDFFFSSFKTILLPGLTFALLNAILSFDVNLPRLYVIAKDFLLYGGQYWFLSALFMGRIIYWFLFNHLSTRKTICVSVLLFFLGFMIAPYYNALELWWFIHAMMLTSYLCLGQQLRYYNDYSYWGVTILYVVTLVVTIFFSYVGLFHIDIIQEDFVLKVPAIVQSFINMNYSMILSLILLSVTGSIMMIGLAKKIGTNSLLEYLGRNSLVIYCTHGIILRKISLYFGDSSFSAYQYYIIVLVAFFLAVAIPCVVAYVMNRRYLNVFIGKF